MRKASVFVIILAVFFLFGCGNNPPELNQIYNQINFINIPDSDIVTAELLVLVNAADEDGEDDIEAVYVIRDQDQLNWIVERNAWSERDSRGMKWTGSQRLSTIDGSLPDSGEYRVLITDRAGERVEDSIFIPVIKNGPKAEDFPSLEFVDSDTVRLKSPNNRNIISFYDAGGELLSAVVASQGDIDIRNLRDGTIIMEGYKTINVSYYSNSIGAGLISGPYLRP